MGTNLSKDDESNSQQIEQPRKPISSHETRNEVSNKPDVIKLPHKFDDILKDADTEKEISRFSTQKLYDQLYSGMYLKQKRQKFWIDKNLKNCFMSYAKDLKITWAEDNRFWHWSLMKDQESSSEVSSFEGAELLNVCWLEIHGRFDTFKLSPGTSYEVVFVVMIKELAYVWNVPINLRLTLPDGTIQHHKENMMEKERGRWIQIPAGDFITPAHPNSSSTSSSQAAGDMEFSLYEYEGGTWKRGIVIKGVSITPKTNL